MADTSPKELRESFADDEAAWADIKQARQEDIKALGPESTWDDKDRAARKENGRPCLAFDELSQYPNQLVNDARETRRAIEVNPSGQGTSEEQARFISALIRQIEDDSNAQMAYLQMLEDAAQGSYGFVRIVPDYLQVSIDEPSARSFDQKLTIQAVPNPNIITPGHFLLPDMTDCQRFWVTDSYEHDAFKLKFPDADIQDVTGHLSDAGPQWVDGKHVWVREIWELKTKRKKLALLPNPDPANPEPMAVWVDTIPKDQKREVLKAALRERDFDQPYVCQKITNGIEVLVEKNDWPGRYLPIVGCLGKTLWIDDKRVILSLIRNARDPQQLYNYYRTSEAELVGMTPKVPWFRYKGALDKTNAQALRDSNQVPVGEIAIDAMPEGWNPAWGPAPFPTRIAYEPPIQALEMGAESTRRAIQAATGTGFMPTDAQRQNEKSGVALRQIETTAQKGAYHLIFNYERAVRRVGEVLVDLIPSYYDTPRDIHVKTMDDKPIAVRINDPSQPGPKEFGGKPLSATDGEFAIALSTGPSYASEREKASEFADQFVSARPETLAMYMDLIIKLKNLGPIGDKMAERAFAMLPANIQKLESGDQPVPPEVQQMQMQLQQAQQIIQQLQRAIETEQVKGQTQIELKQIDGQIKLALEQLKGQQQQQKLAAEVAADIDTREDVQAHEMAMAGAQAASSASMVSDAAYNADKQALFSGKKQSI